MKIYKKQKVRHRKIYCLMHWELDMRSFQVNDTMVLFIQSSGEGNSYINPNWKNLIKGIEDRFLSFLNEEPFSWEVPSKDEIVPHIEEFIEAGEIKYTEINY